MFAAEVAVVVGRKWTLSTAASAVQQWAVYACGGKHAGTSSRCSLEVGNPWAVLEGAHRFLEKRGSLAAHKLVQVERDAQFERPRSSASGRVRARRAAPKAA